VANGFWTAVFGKKDGEHYLPIPGTNLFLRLDCDEDGPLEAVVTHADRSGDPGNVPRRLYFRWDEITLKAPMDMSGSQWTPQGVTWGTTYEGGDYTGPGPTPKKVARDAWLDRSLLALVAEARPPPEASGKPAKKATKKKGR